MKISNINLAFGITKKVIEELGDKIEEKVESVHIHNPDSKIEGLLDEPDFSSIVFTFDDDEDDIDCRDVLWLKKEPNTDYQQFLSIGKEPSRNCWSMDWGLQFDCDSVKTEFSSFKSY